MCESGINMLVNMMLVVMMIIMMMMINEFLVFISYLPVQVGSPGWLLCPPQHHIPLCPLVPP